MSKHLLIRRQRRFSDCYILIVIVRYFVRGINSFPSKKGLSQTQLTLHDFSVRLWKVTGPVDVSWGFPWLLETEIKTRILLQVLLYFSGLPSDLFHHPDLLFPVSFSTPLSTRYTPSYSVRPYLFKFAPPPLRLGLCNPSCYLFV